MVTEDTPKTIYVLEIKKYKIPILGDIEYRKLYKKVGTDKKIKYRPNIINTAKAVGILATDRTFKFSEKKPYRTMEILMKGGFGYEARRIAINIPISDDEWTEWYRNTFK